MTSHPERVRRVLGYMPDGPGIHERVTVGEYLDLFASCHGIHGEHRTRAVGRVLELTEIGSLLSLHVTTLSKGQKQRLLLARTLLWQRRRMDGRSGRVPRAHGPRSSHEATIVAARDLG